MAFSVRTTSAATDGNLSIGRIITSRAMGRMPPLPTDCPEVKVRARVAGKNPGAAQ